MKRLKIGITCYPTIGGSGVIATELGKLLAKKGHEVHFITSSMPFRLEKANRHIYFHEVEVNQYAVFRYPPYDLTLASKMAEVAEREGLDLLHVHYAMPHAVSAYLAKQMVGDKLKIVTTLHGTDITVLGYDPSLRQMIRFGIEQSDVVTAVSKDLIRETKELLQTEKEIVPVYNFVDESLYKPQRLPELKEELGIKEEERVFIHISNFRQVKRVPDVIDTFYKIQSSIPSKLLLVGEGPEFPLVYDKVKSLGIDENVLFLGKQENVSELLSISDLALLLSSKESFGLILLEAAACGVPSIGTRMGGIPEVIDHNETGFIVDVGDTSLAAEYAITILNDQQKYKAMSEAAIAKVEEVFHSEKILEQYEELYYRILDDENV